MSTKTTIKHTLGISDMVMDKYLGDLDPAAFMTRPVQGMNHLAWQMGHLISSERRMVEQIKPGASPALPEGFDAKHGKETHGSDNAADFHTKDEYLKLWKAQRAATHQALDGMTDEELEAPTPDEKTRHMAPTLGTLFSMTGLHSLMHSGQFVAVRRQNEMPIAF